MKDWSSRIPTATRKTAFPETSLSTILPNSNIMPITIFWGEDEFLIQRHVNKLKAQVLDPAWEAFNFSHYPPGAESMANALADLLTPPLGTGSRLVLLPNSSWFGAMDEESLKGIESTIAFMPSTTSLLLTSPKKPDGRLKSTKLLMQHTQEVKEFPLISPWDATALVQRVQSTAHFLNLKITPTAAEALATALGNNTRLLFSELEKLGTYTNGNLIETSAVNVLVDACAQTSLGLAKAILACDRDSALRIWAE
ncbi:MAG: DNA polymerase III subunit delta, partial [Microcystaceae cyanobacterium]